MISSIPAIMDKFKCLFAHICDNLNKEDAIVSVDLIDACELSIGNYLNLRKLLRNSRKS